MAVLSDQNRAALMADFMSEVSGEREAVSITRPNLRAAVNAIDDFLNANAAALNTAIPQPARGALTTAQKARLLMFVVRRRYISGA